MMTQERMAQLFNEWQRRYIDDPTQFASDWAAIKTTLEEQADGKTPSYGSDCAAYLAKLDAELPA